MPASNAFRLSLANLLLQNAAIADIGNTAGLQPSGVAGSLYIGLHTADPTLTGNQTTNEATYTGYARVAVPRTSAAWTTTAGTFANAATVTFPAATAGTNTITYFSIGTLASGTGDLLLSGALTSSLAVSAGISPSFAVGALSGTIS